MDVIGYRSSVGAGTLLQENVRTVYSVPCVPCAAPDSVQRHANVSRERVSVNSFGSQCAIELRE